MAHSKQIPSELIKLIESLTFDELIMLNAMVMTCIVKRVVK